MPVDMMNQSIVMEGVEASLEDFVKTSSCTTFDTVPTSSSSETEASKTTSQENKVKVPCVTTEKVSTIRSQYTSGGSHEDDPAKLTVNSIYSTTSSLESDSNNSTPAVSPTLSDLKTAKEVKKEILNSNASDHQSSSLVDPASDPQCSQEQENSFSKEPAQLTPSQKKEHKRGQRNYVTTPSTINTSSTTGSSNPIFPSPVESLLSLVNEPGFDSSFAVDVLSELAIGIVNPDESNLSNPIDQNDDSDSQSEGDELMGKMKPKAINTTRSKETSDLLDPTPVCSNRKVPIPVPMQTVPSMTRVSAMARMRHMRNNGTITPAQPRNQQMNDNTPEGGPIGDKYKVGDDSYRKARKERAAKEVPRFNPEDKVEEKDPQSDCRSRCSRDLDEEDSTYSGITGGRSVENVDTGDCGVGLLSQPLTEMLWGVLMGPETPKKEEPYYSDSDSSSSHSSGYSDFSSESEESRRGRRRGREKRSEHKVYTNSSQKYKQSESRVFGSNSKRGLGTTNSVKGFLDVSRFSCYIDLPLSIFSNMLFLFVGNHNGWYRSKFASSFNSRGSITSTQQSLFSPYNS